MLPVIWSSEALDDLDGIAAKSLAWHMSAANTPDPLE